MQLTTIYLFVLVFGFFAAWIIGIMEGILPLISIALSMIAVCLTYLDEKSHRRTLQKVISEKTDACPATTENQDLLEKTITELHKTNRMLHTAIETMKEHSAKMSEPVLPKMEKPPVSFPVSFPVAIPTSFQDDQPQNELPADAGNYTAGRSVPEFMKTGNKILLVEDNYLNQMVASDLLEKEDYQVVTAANGKEALEALARGSFDAVLMDIQMPVMDGYEATRKIRSQAVYADLPVIAMTAHTFPRDQAKCREVGMNDHIGKPVDAERLYETLRKWIVQHPIKKAGPSESLPAYLPHDSTSDTEATNRNGIDENAALKRMNGNRNLFINILQSFRNDYKDAPSKIRDLISCQNREEALGLIHAINGVSGMFSEKDLMAEGIALESAIRSQPKDLDARLHQFQESMDRVLKDIETLCRNTKTTVNPENQPSLFPLLMELSPLLEKNNIKAKTLIADAFHSFGEDPFWQETGLSELQTAINRYDYRTAAKILNRIRSNLPDSREG